jgi:O6-methylguanine-DNA--protein-cysteine methyltransferase
MNSKNRVYFQSQEEARALGYRACKVCKPDAPPVEPETLFLAHYRSPLGTYFILSSKQGIVCIEPEEEAKKRIARWQHDGFQIKEGESEYNTRAALELDGYFAGRLSRFDLPLDLRGTPFQRRVWQRLQDIPYGETISYGDLACSLGQINAAKSVAFDGHITDLGLHDPLMTGAQL